jgi:deleted-in-malignant-brain-tumors protein 1
MVIDKDAKLKFNECNKDCSDSDIRLVGGVTVFEGTVEVCYFSTWGLISDAGWSDNEAEVICRHLKYSTSKTGAVSGSYYGKPNRPVHFYNVSCRPDQLSLESCDKILVPLENETYYKSLDVAGVNCRFSNTMISSSSVIPTPSAAPLQGQSIYLYSAIGFMGLLLVLAVVIIVSFILYTDKQRKALKKKQLNINRSSSNRIDVVNPLGNFPTEVENHNLYEINSNRKL